LLKLLQYSQNPVVNSIDSIQLQPLAHIIFFGFKTKFRLGGGPAYFNINQPGGGAFMSFKKYLLFLSLLFSFTSPTSAVEPITTQGNQVLIGGETGNLAGNSF